MKTYEKTNSKDWFTIEAVQTDILYSKGDIPTSSSEYYIKIITEKIKSKEFKMSSEEVEVDGKLKDILDTLISEKVKETLDGLISISVTEVNGIYIGVLNLRDNGEHKQIRF